MIKQVIAALLLTTSVAVAAPTLTASVIDIPAFDPADDTFREITTDVTHINEVNGLCNVYFDAADTNWHPSLPVAGGCATTWGEAFDQWRSRPRASRLNVLSITGVDTQLPISSFVASSERLSTGETLPLILPEPLHLTLEGIVDGALPDDYVPISGDDLLAELLFQQVPPGDLVNFNTPETITPLWNMLYDPDIPEYASLIGVRAYFEDEGSAIISSQYDNVYAGSLAAYQDGVDNYYYPTARITRIEFDRLWAEGADDRTAVIATYLNANGGWLNGETGNARMDRLWEEVNDPDTPTDRLENIARILTNEGGGYSRTRVATRAYAKIAERSSVIELTVADPHNPNVYLSDPYDQLCNPRNRDNIEFLPIQPGTPAAVYQQRLVDHISGGLEGWIDCPDGREIY